ncbi:polysaccharide deacetylase family protein [Sphingomonas sp. GlSt437]|uniref:polysaccharide deacetylase family protein n=1 Tax=Sphingomonas sp. GlSt437 TaxID=3389970 RepID=UPI003A89F336
MSEGATTPRGHRVAPPARDALIAWPADFGTRALIFVDTEEEFDWRQPLSRDNRATTAVAALPDAARRFAGWGAPWAMIVDHPVATDPHAIDLIRTILADHPQSAIGTQLHPWVNPPFDEAVTPANSFPGNLPEALEAAKLDALTEAIAAAFGKRPTAYRAGRYGIGPNTLRLLASRGYRLDSSVRAGHDYLAEGGPDFRDVGPHAYWADRAGGVIELPLTTVFTGLLGDQAPSLYRAASAVPAARGLLARTGLASRIALTPEGMPIADALEAIRVAVGQGVRVLAFSFHSPSLVPGHTPYVRDAADLKAFWAWWDATFALMARLGIAPIGLDALIAAADAGLAGAGRLG